MNLVAKVKGLHKPSFNQSFFILHKYSQLVHSQIINCDPDALLKRTPSLASVLIKTFSELFQGDILMDLMSVANGTSPNKIIKSSFVSRNKPSREEAEEAVRCLIQWAGDDPGREGLSDTPKRVVKSYSELFSGYSANPEELLKRMFEETSGYCEMILLKDIAFESFCEHHMLPIIGKVHVGYTPKRKVVGISKLARVVDAFSKRLQIQERCTQEIANTINSVLNPEGVGVIIEAAHQCMTMRGVHKSGVTMSTTCLLGSYRIDLEKKREFLHALHKG